MEDFAWTTGGQFNVSHKRLIDVGGFGEVHEVYNLATPILSSQLDV